MGQIIDGAFYSDYDAQDIDRRLAIAGGVSNPNLLDNSWFTVNQRGAISGNANGDYIADRWSVSYGSGGITWSRTNDSITFQPVSNTGTPYIMQKMEESLYTFLGGKTVTISVMLGDYSILSATTIFNSDATFEKVLAVDSQGNITNCVVSKTQRTFSIIQENVPITIRAVKLEVGSVSTLANDVAPNCELELQKCRGHVLVVGGDSTTVLTGWMANTTLMRGNTLTSLNFTPTTISMTGSFYVYAGGSLADVSSVALMNSNKHNIDVTTSAALQNNAIAIMRGGDSSSKIVISDGLG